jgi:hypothetical protein
MPTEEPTDEPTKDTPTEPTYEFESASESSDKEDMGTIAREFDNLSVMSPPRASRMNTPIKIPNKKMLTSPVSLVPCCPR